MISRKTALGFFYLIMFSITIPLASYLRHQIGTYIDPSLLIFLSTLWAIIFYHILNIGRIKTHYNILLAKDNRKQYLYLMISVAAIWLGSFLIPIYYSAFIDLFSYFAIQALFGYFYKFKANKKIMNLIALLLALIINILFIYKLYNIFSGLNLLICYLLMAITAVGTWNYKTISYSFKDIMPTSFLIASRFYVLLLISGIAVAWQHPPMPGFTVLMETLVIAMSSLIIPIYFSQKSIEILSPINNSIGSSFAPFLVLIIEKLLHVNKIDSIDQILFSTALIIIMVVPLYRASAKFKPYKLKWLPKQAAILKNK